jgi:hypothetical protein
VKLAGGDYRIPVAGLLSSLSGTYRLDEETRALDERNAGRCGYSPMAAWMSSSVSPYVGRVGSQPIGGPRTLAKLRNRIVQIFGATSVYSSGMASDAADLLEQLSIERRRVDVAVADLTVREVVRMARDGEMNAAPAYQRKFRWTPSDEARLIESPDARTTCPKRICCCQRGLFA